MDPPNIHRMWPKSMLKRYSLLSSSDQLASESSIDFSRKLKNRNECVPCLSLGRERHSTAQPSSRLRGGEANQSWLAIPYRPQWARCKFGLHLSNLAADYKFPCYFRVAWKLPSQHVVHVLAKCNESFDTRAHHEFLS